MLRLVLVLSAVLVCGSIGAFFLFVPPLVIAVAALSTVVLLVTGYALLYCFGAPPEQKH